MVYATFASAFEFSLRKELHYVREEPSIVSLVSYSMALIIQAAAARQTTLEVFGEVLSVISRKKQCYYQLQ